MTIDIRTMTQDDWPAVARLIYDSTNAWYAANGRPPAFQSSPEDVVLFCQVYEDLDPGCCLLAIDTAQNTIAGSCFYHPRPTHVSLGIMNAKPEYFGQGIARRLLQAITQIADQQKKPVRLVSSAVNLDSYSLYNRAGFTPRAIFQDMTMVVPQSGVTWSSPKQSSIRTAQPEDVPRMVSLEAKIVGIQRGGDFEYFIRNQRDIWHTLVAEDDAGKLLGFLASVAHPASNMLGPGVAIDDDTAAQLIAAQLGHHRGRQPVWLVPADRPQLVQAMYVIGAKNCELHFSQVRGEAQPLQGVMLPTFMPETA